MLKSWAVVGLVALVLIVGLGFVKAGDTVAEWAAGSASPDYERLQAEQAIRELELPAKFLNIDHPAHRLVERTGQKLVTAITPGTRYQYRFHVVKSPEVNAFALPGGDIMVYTGLLRIITHTDQLAAVLSHEIEHVERQHGLKNAYRATSLGVIMLWTFGLASDGVLDIAHTLAISKYSRALETEADLFGAELMQRAGYSRQAMVDMLNLLAQAGNSNRPAWLSDHPDSAARAAKVAAATATVSR